MTNRSRLNGLNRVRVFFGPRKRTANPGAPADHFPRSVPHKRALRSVRAERKRRGI